MKKLAILIILILIISLLFTSCSVLGDENMIDNSSDTDNKDERLEKVLDALIDRDKEGIRAMFSQSALSEADEFDENLDYLLGFFQGEVMSSERKGASAFEDKNLNGVSQKVYEWYRVDTNIQSYLFIFIEILKDTENPRNVGLYTLRVIRAEDEETQFCSWDDVEKPGIFKP